MKNLINAIFLFFLAAAGLPAQGLHIYLDASKGTSTFVSGKDTLSKPEVKRGETITLHLLNFNNYLYEVEVEESQRQVTYFSTGIDTTNAGGIQSKSAGNNAFDLISTIMNPSGLLGLGQLATGQLSMISGLPFGLKGFALEEEEMAVMRDMEELEFKYEMVLEDWARTENELFAIQSEVEKLVNSKAVQSLAYEEIRNLQYNPNLSATQIKDLSEEYLNMVFASKPISEIDMNYLWKLHQKGQDISIHLKNLETERSNYNFKLAEIQQLSLNLSAMKSKIRSSQLLDIYNQIDQSLQSSLTKGEKEVKRLDMTYEDLKNLVTYFGEEDLQQLIRLRYTYEEIASNDFSYTYQTTAKEDITSLTVKMNPKDDLPSHLKVGSKKLAALEVTARGGLKINGSIGLGFGQFFDPPQSYFVRDSVILSEQEGSFAPYLASFLHFYNHKPGQMAFGGSFGVGIPVFNSGGTDLSSIAFFLGPSLFMGGAQRITLTGGVMGARVQALSNGYQVGDILDNPLLGIPTTGKYQLGYFIGISINVIGN